MEGDKAGITSVGTNITAEKLPFQKTMKNKKKGSNDDQSKTLMPSILFSKLHTIEGMYL